MGRKPTYRSLWLKGVVLHYLVGIGWAEIAKINIAKINIAKINEVESATSESKTPQGLKDFWKDIDRYSRMNLDSVRE